MQHLSLSGTGIGDDSFAAVKQLHDLIDLNINCTAISNNGLRFLHGKQVLEKITNKEWK